MVVLVLVLFSDGDWQIDCLLGGVKFYAVVLGVIDYVCVAYVVARDFEFDGSVVAQFGVGFLELEDEVFEVHCVCWVRCWGD